MDPIRTRVTTPANPLSAAVADNGIFPAADPANDSSASAPRRLNLALQGGGSHGAFTWGVLDRLLDEENLQFEGLSGSSAGAMNAVVFADGWLKGGRSGAREALATFWTEVAKLMPPGMVVQGEGEAIQLSTASKLLASWAGHFSPAQLNPLELNPLRDLLGFIILPTSTACPTGTAATPRTPRSSRCSTSAMRKTCCSCC